MYMVAWESYTGCIREYFDTYAEADKRYRYLRSHNQDASLILNVV